MSADPAFPHLFHSFASSGTGTLAATLTTDQPGEEIASGNRLAGQTGYVSPGQTGHGSRYATPATPISVPSGSVK
jgi:hypothetical protein